MIELLESTLTLPVHEAHKDEIQRNEPEPGLVESLMGLSLLGRTTRDPEALLKHHQLRYPITSCVLVLCTPLPT